VLTRLGLGLGLGLGLRLPGPWQGEKAGVTGPTESVVPEA